MFSQRFHRFSCESAENSRFMKTYMKNIESTLSKLLEAHSLETTVANYRRHQQAGLQHASPWIGQIHMSISFFKCWPLWKREWQGFYLGSRL